MRDAANLRWISCKSNEFFWYIPFSGFRYSSQDTLPSDSVTVSAYSFDPVWTIMDTGTTLTYVPWGMIKTLNLLRNVPTAFRIDSR
jgi:hypothetical protein